MGNLFTTRSPGLSSQYALECKEGKCHWQQVPETEVATMGTTKDLTNFKVVCCGDKCKRVKLLLKQDKDFQRDWGDK